MPITWLRTKTPEQVHDAVSSFAAEYVAHWNQWLTCHEQDRVATFGSILRSWQAVRPRTMRRPRDRAPHPPPHLEDIFRNAEPHLATIRNLDLQSFGDRTAAHEQALGELWKHLQAMAIESPATCVGITKGVLLLTNGRIGPAIDSEVRRRLALDPIATAEQWIDVLDQVSEDIIAFEEQSGPLQDAVPAAFAALECGRLYDMTAGPR